MEYNFVEKTAEDVAARSSSMIVMHDSMDRTAKDLEHLIKRIKSTGKSFVSPETCLNLVKSHGEFSEREISKTNIKIVSFYPPKSLTEEEAPMIGKKRRRFNIMDFLNTKPIGKPPKNDNKKRNRIQLF